MDLSTPRVCRTAAFIGVFSLAECIVTNMLQTRMTSQISPNTATVNQSAETGLKKMDGFTCHVMTRARKRKQDVQELITSTSDVTTFLIPDGMTAQAVEPPAESRRKRRRLQQGERIRNVLEPWTGDFLVEQQSADPNFLPSVRAWLEGGMKSQ